MRLFMDTMAFISIEAEDDENHEAALSYREGIKVQGEIPLKGELRAISWLNPLAHTPK